VTNISSRSESSPVTGYGLRVCRLRFRGVILIHRGLGFVRRLLIVCNLVSSARGYRFIARLLQCFNAPSLDPISGSLKTQLRQEDGEWTCHFISPGGTLLLVKRYPTKTKNTYLMGPATVSPPRSSLSMAAAIARAARALGCRSQGSRHDESISTKT
jgi:hypothetical protein